MSAHSVKEFPPRQQAIFNALELHRKISELLAKRAAESQQEPPSNMPAQFSFTQPTAHLDRASRARVDMQNPKPGSPTV